MADFIFNQAKGRWVEWASQVGTANAEFGVVILQVTGLDPDATMIERATLADVLANSTEADFTNYARKILALTLSLDTVNDWWNLNATKLTWTAAGGTVDNDLAKLIVYYDPDTTTSTDADRIPVSAHDLTISTDGNDLELQPIAAAGFARAS